MPFNNGFEGAMDLDPERFATVILEDQMKNDRQHNIGYALQPFGPGTARHYAADERWTLHDIYVTRSKPVENDPPFGHGLTSRPDSYLLGTSANLSGIFDHEGVQNQHLVLWHRTSAHHDPHDEDQAADDPTDAFKGITLIHWSGFDLVPHNLFNSNPLGGPHRKRCDGYQ
jgi:Cu2+-containing amine oxidase